MGTTGLRCWLPPSFLVILAMGSERTLICWCIYIKKVIVNLWGMMHLNLQRKIFQWSFWYSLGTRNIDLITSFIQDSANKQIPSPSVSSVPLITPDIRRKIRRKNKTHAKAKTTGSSTLRSKFEIVRRETKADGGKQHYLYVYNLVGDVKPNPRDFYRYINSH